MFPKLEKQISDSIEYAKRNHQMAHLSDDEIPKAYEHLRIIVEHALATVEFLRGHRHEWDENGFCCHCNADGNA